jgi:hypothetical protein
MAIATDFEIQADKDIRYIGAAHGASGAGYYTVLEFHRWLQDLADDSGATGDDLLDISRPTPSDKAFDTIITLVNGFNIDAPAAEHLYGGSIIQGTSGAEIYDGVQVIAGAGAHVEVVQNGAIITNDFWNTVPFGGSLKGLNSDAANGISHRFMVLVRTAGADIDGRRLLLQTREWGYSFSEFKINGTGRGVNVAALTYAADLNNATASGTVAGYTDVTNLTAGYASIDADGNATPENYYSKWDRASRSINQFYERMKYLTRRGSAETLYGLNGELFRGITHEITVDTPSATDFSAVEAVSWSGGTGQMLAINDVNAPTKMWIQLRTGVPPTDNQTITGGTSGATCLVNVTVTERALSFPFCGVSTGSAIIGAYGFGIEATDLSVADKVFDLTNTLRQPPNLVTFTVAGLVSSEDQILVGPDDGAGALDEDQFTLNGALTGASVTSVVVNEAIPTDTPATGTIRIKRANGAFSRHPYSAYNTGTKTFTITSHNFSTNNAANGAFTYISYIDKTAAATTESFQSTYVSDRALYVRRRDGGSTPTKTFETTATLGASGGSVTVQRLSDA